MKGTTVLVWLVVVVLVSGTHAALHRAPDCPNFCVCTTWLLIPKASCTGRRLYSVDTGISNIVQALDLSNNSISKLENRQLSRAGLTKLKYLNLSMNAISEISGSAFDDLRNLTVLDLSMNHIDYIDSDTFYDNTNLQILHLSYNKFNRKVPILHSKSIVELSLKECRIVYLPKDTFLGLTKLRKLDLSSNFMFELDKEILRSIPSLKNISLGRNLWSCNSNMLELKKFMRLRGIRSDPVCERIGLTSHLERIIGLKSTTTEAEVEKKPSETRLVKDRWEMDSWRKLEEAVQEQERERDPKTGGIFAGALGTVSPFWFLLIGFLLGSGATMVVTYLWLSTTISCLIPRIRRAEAADSTDASSQRVSLLRHLWQQDNAANTEESTNATTSTVQQQTTPSCPGTPPPPYREVMLHRNLYPRAAGRVCEPPSAPVYNI